MPPDRDFIDESLASLEENLLFLQQLSQRPADQFLRSKEATYSAAYALTISIEAIAGIASHLLASLNHPVPKGMADSFECLFQKDILKSSGLVERLGQMSRFRNLLVHRYWNVDYAVVHQILQTHLDDFRLFAREIQNFLD
ncbi:MAG: DUF86 domain-containing protein [Candidatus Eremiobacteraeota bacterium]|nr:DUF86 domain-containing protein [Candidatus Eremiobacteraeota bacterium]